MADDLLNALVSGSSQSPEQVQAIVNQLRGRNNLGSLAVMSGDPALAPLGHQILQEGQQESENLGQRAMQNRQDDIRQEQYERQLKQGEGMLNETIRYHNMEDQERQNRLEQQKELHDSVAGANQSGLVDMIGSYRAPPMSSRSNQAIAIMDAVQQKYPQYDATLFEEKKKAAKDFGTGPQGNMVRAAPVSLQHLDLADQKADLMGNTSYPAVNWLKNTVGAQFNPDIAKGVAGLDTAKQIVSDEINKFFINGGGAEKDRDALQEKLSLVKAPAALHEVTDTLRQLMAGQMNGLKGQYETSFGGDFLKDKLKNDPHVLDTLGWDGNQFTGKRQAQSPQGAPGPAPQGPAPQGGTQQSPLQGAIAAAYPPPAQASAPLPNAAPGGSTGPGGPSTAAPPAAPRDPAVTGHEPIAPGSTIGGKKVMGYVKSSKGRLGLKLEDGTVVPLDGK